MQHLVIVLVVSLIAMSICVSPEITPYIRHKVNYTPSEEESDEFLQTFINFYKAQRAKNKTAFPYDYALFNHKMIDSYQQYQQAFPKTSPQNAAQQADPGTFNLIK